MALEEDLGGLAEGATVEKAAGLRCREEKDEEDEEDEEDD